MIKKLVIKGFHGVSKDVRTVKFNEDLTILVGKNGAGKTTILGILNSIIYKNFEKLFNYNFMEATLQTEYSDIKVIKDNISLQINYIVYTDCGDVDKDLTQTLIIEKNEDNKFTHQGVLDNFIPYDSKYFPTYRRIETDLFDLLSDFNELDGYNHYYPRRIFQDLSKLVSSETENNSNMILGLSNKDINRIIKKKWNEVTEYEKTELSKLIKNFVFSLLSPNEGGLSASKIKNFRPIEVQSQLEQIFKQVGFIDENNKKSLELIKDHVNQVEWASKIFNENDKKNERELADLGKAVEIFMSYSKIEKLLEMYKETYDDIYQKRKSFDELVLALKEFIDMEIQLMDGNLRFSKEGYDITFEKLSAGEKQLVSMFVYTKLSLGDNGIVIIDEPELSLHINWQRKFIKFLTNGTQKLQYIVSTHSPFIISGYKEKLAVLDELGDDDNGF